MNEKKWEFAPYLSKPRGDLKLIVFQNTLYALGGRSGAKSFNNVEYFDNTTESWITTTPMLRARCDFAAVVHNNRIYVVGGNEYKDYELKNNEIAFVECFDPNTKTWMHVRISILFPISFISKLFFFLFEFMNMLRLHHWIIRGTSYPQWCTKIIYLQSVDGIQHKNTINPSKCTMTLMIFGLLLMICLHRWAMPPHLLFRIF